MADITVIKGDSTDIQRFTVDGVTDLTGYTCRVVVVDYVGSATYHVDKTVSSENDGTTDYFDVKLTPTETDSIDVGDYKTIVEIDSGSSFNRETVLDLRVNTQGID